MHTVAHKYQHWDRITRKPIVNKNLPHHFSKDGEVWYVYQFKKQRVEISLPRSQKIYECPAHLYKVGAVPTAYILYMKVVNKNGDSRVKVLDVLKKKPEPLAKYRRVKGLILLSGKTITKGDVVGLKDLTVVATGWLVITKKRERPKVVEDNICSARSLLK